MTKARTTIRQPRKGVGATTLADVARLAGVSVITVSRALSMPQLVSAATREKVHVAVECTGYVPNLQASGQASNRSRLVAAMVPTIAGPVFLETVQSLTETLAASGYQLLLGQSGYDHSREDALIDAMVGRRPDGIVLTGIVRSAAGRQRLIASGIPVVETWDLTPTPIDMLVGFSHERVGAAMAHYLLGKGHRRMALITGDDQRARRRCDSFQRTLRAAGVAEAPVCTVPAPTTLAGGRDALARLLQAHPRIDALACSSDALAHGAIIEAQVRGIDVPGRLGVMGFGDMAFAGHTYPPITTVDIDGNAIGRQAARFIVDGGHVPDDRPKIVDIGFSVVERASA
ncbi:LacI family DNA-binding transcriptional regulator [Xylophilus ampelinus]|uniref:LacI family transcriptional regulator n=1 Tax=Xylophilus ampelinus TaxID=54067 RepID=A0A318SMD7_9BURK|nr:LacI family DNA-binding transcriptional regulator [Xylophilus ampelinus]MCS4509176.1 LacI family DNA-binding transcriptional regulator [Xylophilus ampelinus]PYE79798.1 LacI family transcriptional regulator [Xylophilus ampelinus]